jgi:molybdopterin converting factor small subunit
MSMVRVALYGGARVVTGQRHVEVMFDTTEITIGEVLNRLIGNYPRVRPYVLDETGSLPLEMRILLNEVRPEPDATLATILRDGDRLALLMIVAGG